MSHYASNWYAVCDSARAHLVGISPCLRHSDVGRYASQATRNGTVATENRWDTRIAPEVTPVFRPWSLAMVNGPEPIGNELTLERALDALIERLLAREERAGRAPRHLAVSARLVGGG